MLGGKVLPKSMHVALCTHREMNSMQNSTARHTKWVLDKCCICIIDKKPSSLPLLYHILLGCLEFFLSSIVAEFASFLWDFIDYNKRKQKRQIVPRKLCVAGFFFFLSTGCAWPHPRCSLSKPKHLTLGTQLPSRPKTPFPSGFRIMLQRCQGLIWGKLRD